MELNFNCDEVEETYDENKTVDDGRYLVAVIKSKEFKSNGRAGVYIGFQIIESGRWKNWHIADFFTLKSTNPKAVAVGKGKLKRLCEAVGKKKVADSSQLHGSTLYVTVETRGEYQNIVKYETAGKKGLAPSEVPQGTTAPAAPQASTETDNDDIPF